MVYNLERLIEACSWKPSFNLHYSKYYLQINLANRIMLNRLSDFLVPKVGDAIATVGSDARLEKGYTSRIELTILLSENCEKEPYFKLSEEFPSLIHPLLDFKKIISKSYLYMDDSRRVFPTRIFDLRFIAGDYDRFVYEKSKFIQEIKLDHQKIKKALRNKRKYYLDILTTGFAEFKKTRFKHYDLETGEIFYNNKTQWGLKFGPLRTIQYHLAYNINKILRQTGDIKFLLNLPSTIVERLYYLENNPYTCPEINELSDNYMFFLKEYHLSQKVFKDLIKKENNNPENKTLAMIYNANDWSEIKERIFSVYQLLKTKN